MNIKDLMEDFGMLTTPSGEVLSEAKAKRKHMDPWMQHCVAGVVEKGRSTESAFAICSAQGQKAGYYEPGSRTLTDKGQKAARSKAAEKKHKAVQAQYKAATTSEARADAPAENMEEAKKWIKGAVKHPGALHKALGVKKGETIPTKKLRAIQAKLAKKAEGSKKLSPKELKLFQQVNMALTLRSKKVPPHTGPREEREPQAVLEAKGDAHAKIKDFYMKKGMKEEEASQIADKTVAKLRKKKLSEATVAESREAFMPWVEMHSEQNHLLDGDRRVFTFDASHGGAFLREATRAGGILENYPGQNLVRVRFGDGDMMMRRNSKGYAVVVPPLAGAQY